MMEQGAPILILLRILKFILMMPHCLPAKQEHVVIGLLDATVADPLR